MTASHSSQLTASDVEQPAKYEELNDRNLRSSPHLEEGPAHPGVDGRPASPIDDPVEDRHGQELQPSRKREWTARDDVGYTGAAGGNDGHYADVESMDGQAAADRFNGDPGELLSTTSGAAGAYWHGAHVNASDESLPTVPAPFAGAHERARFPLATEERIAGEHAELERQREKAHAAAAVGIARARRCRAEVEPQQSARRDEGQAVLDPREHLDQEELAAVNQEAYRLADDLSPAPSTAVLGRDIAAKVLRGAGIEEAVFSTREEWHDVSGIAEPIASVDPWAYEVTIQGTVETLFEPKDVSQKQVGLVRDDTGTAKVTVWKKSGDKPILHEGDEVRICYGKPGEYKGRPTVAVTADTRVVVLERGDGPAPTWISSRSWESATDFSGEQRRTACTAPGPSEGEAVWRPTHVPEERRSVPVEQPDAVTKAKVDKHSLTAGAWLQTDVVYPSVAIVPRFSADDIERRKDARTSDDPTESGAASNYEPIAQTVVRMPFPDGWLAQAAVSEASSEPTGGWFGDEAIDDGRCPVPHCDFEGETAKVLLGHLGAKVREHSAGPHARVQVDLAERGVTDIDGEAPLGVETPDADAPLADRPAFPPRPGAAFRLSRSVSTEDEAAASNREASESTPRRSADEPGDAAVVTPAADGGEAVAGPTTTARCPDCGHERATYKLQQTRAADEPPTRLYSCLECGHRWREDD